MPTEEKISEPKMRCPSCGMGISTTEMLTVRGQATVQGYASIRDFHDHGVVWVRTSDSESEEFHCPHCEEWFMPDWIALREMWRKKER